LSPAAAGGGRLAWWVRPVFVLGLPRTGTTLLHALLASVPGHRAPLLWELLAPCPPVAGQDLPGRSIHGQNEHAPRVRSAERFARLGHLTASMRVIHPRPEPLRTVRYQESRRRDRWRRRR